MKNLSFLYSLSIWNKSLHVYTGASIVKWPFPSPRITCCLQISLSNHTCHARAVFVRVNKQLSDKILDRFSSPVICAKPSQISIQLPLISCQLISIAAWALFLETFSKIAMLCEKPRTATEGEMEKHLFCYCQYHCVVSFYEDVKTIEESMAQSQKEGGRRSKHCRRKRGTIRAPKLENIKEEEGFDFETVNEEEKIGRDLAEIHRERALSCGALVPLQNEGRRFRLKKYLSVRHRSNST